MLAGGCFWGVQAVFQHVKGVKEAVSGYAGGDKETAAYEQVSTGRTGHAESVEVTFDPHVVSYGTILQIYFSVAHNPTELNYQGPDSGTQYRSEIFAESDEQKRVADAYIAQLDAAKAFSAPIVTRVEAAARLLSRRGASSELRDAQSRQRLYRLQRRPQGRESLEAVPRRVPAEAEAGRRRRRRLKPAPSLRGCGLR